MKKALLLAASALFALTGCHGAEKQFTDVVLEDEYAFDETKKYEITFWAKNDTNKTQTNIYNKAVEDFEKLYPNIDVNIRLYTDYGKIYNDVITNIATGTTPNVCITYPDHIATYMTGQNIVVNLDELMKDKNYGLGGAKVKFDSPTKEEIVPEYLEECRIGGVCYALPYMRSTEACYINKTYIEKMGYTIPETLTWDFVWEVSEAAMEKGADGNFKVNGQNVMIPFIYKSTDNMMITMLKQLGAGYSQPDGSVQIFNDDTKNILKEVSVHAKSRSFSTFKISSYPGNFFNAGQCLFAIDSTAGASWLGSDAPLMDIHEGAVVDFETQVMAVPQFNVDDPKMISQGPSMCIFNREDHDEVIASWLFMQFMLTNEVQIAYSQTEGYVPVTTKARQTDTYKDYLARCGEDNDLYYHVKIEAAKLLLDNTANTFVTPVFNGSASLRDAAGELIESVTKDTRRKKTIDEEYFKTLFANVTSLYKLDQIRIVKLPDATDTEEGNVSAQDAEEAARLAAVEGPLPNSSVILITLLCIAWAGIIGFAVYRYVKTVREKNNKGGSI